MLLAADVGGTKALLGLYHPGRERPRPHVIREYATLDFLSNGRLDFGVGVGWSWEEFEAVGAPWERRGARCDEYLDVITTLWCDDVSSYEGEFYQLKPCHMYPKPAQKPMVPITVGGHSTAALKRTAKYGSGWYGINLDPAGTADILPTLDRHLAGPDHAASLEPAELADVMAYLLSLKGLQ